jgi:hypothetical protein
MEHTGVVSHNEVYRIHKAGKLQERRRHHSLGIWGNSSGKLCRALLLSWLPDNHNLVSPFAKQAPQRPERVFWPALRRMASTRYDSDALKLYRHRTHGRRIDWRGFLFR